MSTLATALKDEIRRLARKEIKAQTGRTAKAVAQYRRDIAQLKRQQRELEKRLALRESQGAVQRSPVAQLNGDARFSARSVKAQRRGNSATPIPISTARLMPSSEGSEIWILIEVWRRS